MAHEAMARLRRITAGGWLRIVVVACALLALGLVALARAQAPTPDRARALIGHPAPAFSAPAAQDGHLLPQPTRYDPRSGGPTLLVFFDTLCVHCVAGVQTANATATTAPTSLRVIYLDAPGENAEITGAYMARLRVAAPVLLDVDARIASRYGVAYYPSFVLIDPHGVVRAVWTGTPSASELRAAIAQTTRAPSPAHAATRVG
ncbi:MAG: TlpA family protein disulfide reductase [Chloroflexota bacterium]|nr:TlpA family protein disulfide reductase [Chloroflexota bacterium]